MPSSRRHIVAHVALLLPLLAAVRPLMATVVSSTAPPCGTGPISEIFIDNSSVFDAAQASGSRLAWAYRWANRLHVRTREEVIRRELLFRVGDCYDPALLDDTERVLRAVPFLAAANAFAVRQDDGSYRVVVETRDDWSLRLEPRVNTGGESGLTGLELREDNLLGTGQSVAAFMRRTGGDRIYGAQYATTQLFRTHVNALVSVARTPIGASYTERLTYPFRGEAARWAVRQQMRQEEDYFQYFGQQDGERVRYLFPQRRQSAELGGVFRIGRRGNLSLFGLGMAGERVAYPDGAVVLRNGLIDSVGRAESSLAGLDSVADVRLVFLAGQRNVRFSRLRALDAVRADEDVRLGSEVELGIGRSLATFSTDDNVAVNFGLFAAGLLPGRVVAGARGVVQAKRDFAASDSISAWRNVFAQARAWAYWRPSADSRHTLVASLRAAGGWNVDVPFQLTLGSSAGLRGFGRHTFSGQRRAVATIEERMYLGRPFAQLFDLGTAVFVDAGRIWTGDDPFGVDSRPQLSAGVGLRGAFPAGSRRTYRLDVAAPLTGGLRVSALTITVGTGQSVGYGVGDDDPQIRRSAGSPLSASLFTFPN